MTVGKSLRFEHMRVVKAKYETELLKKANVVAVGIGVPIRDGKPAGEPGIIVSVSQKVAASELSDEDLVPQVLEDVPVWVEAIDRPRALNADTEDTTTSNQDQRGSDHGISLAGQRSQDLSRCTE